MKTFKNITTALIFALSLTACTDKSDDEPDSNILGLWTVDKVIDNGIELTLDNCEVLETLNFLETTVTATIYEGQNCEDSEQVTMNYNIDGDQLRTISDLTGVQSITIHTLTENTLILHNYENGLVDLKYHYKR